MTTRLLLLLALMMWGCEKKPPTDTPDVGPATAQPADAGKAPTPQPMAKATDVGRVLRQVNAAIVHHTKQGEKRGGWVHFESLAGAHLSRARLTGNIDDYVAAGAAIDRAFEVAVDGSGPFYGRAHYNYTIHRISEVEADLVKAEKRLLRQNDDMERVAALRGDVAFHRGELDKARKLYAEALGHRHTLATVARIAFLDLKTGNIDAARKGYEEAAELAKNAKDQRAFALLHRGIVELEVGDVGEALKWYEQANEAYSGWYLVEEHIAEAKLLLGEPDAAIEMYESILARTPSGEFMAAMAECYAAKDDAKNEAEWVKKAKEAFERDIAKLPSAATGHALEFYLVHDHARALELAKANAKLRPNHEARIQLAQAYLANKNEKKARQTLEPILDSAWDTPDFWATVAIVFPDRADKADPNDVADLREQLGL